MSKLTFVFVCTCSYNTIKDIRWLQKTLLQIQKCLPSMDGNVSQPSVYFAYVGQTLNNHMVASLSHGIFLPSRPSN
jgi:hypothetical protein